MYPKNTASCIQYLYPNSESLIDWIVESRGTEVSIAEWNTELGNKPTEAEINAVTEQVKNQWKAQEYARNRKVEYDALNQFELMTDDAINSTTTHLDAINVIKAKYPKPE